MKYEKLINNLFKQIELCVVEDTNIIYMYKDDHTGVETSPSIIIKDARYYCNEKIKDAFGNCYFDFIFLCDLIRERLLIKITNDAISNIIYKNDPILIKYATNKK